ncbi:MAG: hypothetical protein BGO63_02315 [Candidatus Accumulibacter sp. 66-26]|nr:hypothetical protein [Accumulibacter sp.]OJW47988.1 MAG: hypothetical protein BGO63_02315 [Candidatus Accumulibacter sp. 66-26]
MNDIYTSHRRPYYIYAPDYVRISAGIKALHLLCHYLNKMGEEAYVHTQQTNLKLRTPLLTDEVRKRHAAIDAQPIAVYPEILHGNPLNTKHVVRYILNHPGLLGGPKTFDDSELLICYHSEFQNDVSKINNQLILTTPTIDITIFNNEDNGHDDKRSGYLIYPGRYSKAREEHPDLFDKGTVITYQWPQTHEELAALLRKSTALYCFSNSAIAAEAVLCGCPVVIMTSPFTVRPKDFHDPDKIDGFVEHPGISSGDSVAELALARQNTVAFQETHRKERQDFVTQLAQFIKLSQEMQASAPTAGRAPTNAVAAGIQAFNNADNDTAAKHLSTALAEAPEDPIPYVYLALISARSNLLEEAENFIQFAQSLAPERHDFVAALGEECLKNGHNRDALRYLQQAVDKQPDLFPAYPALAEALRLNDRQDQAIHLLNSAAAIPSAAQEQILGLLLEWLATQANIDAIPEVCLRLRNHPGYQALGIALLTRTGMPPERIRAEARHYVQPYLASGLTASMPNRGKAGAPLVIAFLVSDFRREQLSGRLEALLQHLPPERFISVVLYNDPQAGENETAQRCSLINDHSLITVGREDIDVLQAMRELDIQILVDMDGLGVEHRLSLFGAADVPLKLSWSDTPLLREAGIACVRGAALLNEGEASDTDVLLPGLGEILALPRMETSPRVAAAPLTFGCLSSAVHFSRDCWESYALILARAPDSRLVVNLGELGASAQEFISTFFIAQGVDLLRLDFIHATDISSLCTAWNLVDVGLAPLHGPGDMALPAALWMEKCYIALRGDSSWSRRPGALLRQAGQDQFLADSVEAYIALACDLSRPPLPQPPGLRQKLQDIESGQASVLTLTFADLIEQRYRGDL